MGEGRAGVHSCNEDPMASAQQTRDHETIRSWTEERSGIPVIVKGTGGLLRIDFVDGPESGGRDPNLEETDWSRWFQIFDENNLQFLYDPEPQSKFFKLVSAENAGAESTRKKPAPRRSSRSRAKAS